MQDQEQSIKMHTLKVSLLFSVLIPLGLYYSGYSKLAFGFVFGAILSVFSFISLAIVVPFLFRPGSSPAVKGLLGITLYMKLPLYMVILYFGTRLPGVSPGMMAVGIGLVPAVISVKGILEAMTGTERARQKATERATSNTTEAVREGA